MVSARGFCHFM